MSRSDISNTITSNTQIETCRILYDKLIKPALLTNPITENQCISPASIYYLLSLCRACAAGESANELNQFLGDRDLFFDGTQTSTPLSAIQVALLAWAKSESCQATPECKKKLELLNADYLTGMKHSLNEWASKKTNGVITDFISESEQQDLITLLASSVYFKGEFVEPFVVKATHPREFTNEDGSKKTTMMMYDSNRDVKYLSTPKAKYICLPYTNGTIGVFVLPTNNSNKEKKVNKKNKANDSHKDVSMTEFLSTSTLEDFLPPALFKAYPQELDNILIPKFEIQTKANLTNVLTNSNLFPTFMNHPDMSPAFGMRMTEANANTTSGGTAELGGDVQFKHNTVIKTDEQGTTAASIACRERLESYCPHERIEWIGDTPFLQVVALPNNNVVLPLFIAVVSKF